MVVLVALLAFTGGLVASERQRVTFVLAADNASPGFFSAAIAYFAAHPELAGTLVTSARSLADVREFLIRSPLREELPWGEIRLVAHGSQWYGLRVPIFADGPWATQAALDRVVANQEFPALPDDVLDADSLIRIESCGIARRPDLLQAMSRLFSRGGQMVRVQSSAGYVVFQRWQDDAGAQRSAREEIAYEYAIIAGVRPDSPRVIELLRRRWLRSNGVAAATLQINKIPIALDFPIAIAPQHWRAALKQAPVRETLRDLGITSRQLHWEMRDGRLEGSATLFLLAPAGVDVATEQALLDEAMH